jgi:hypothetical protein
MCGLGLAFSQVGDTHAATSPSLTPKLSLLLASSCRVGSEQTTAHLPFTSPTAREAQLPAMCLPTPEVAVTSLRVNGTAPRG